MSRRARLDLPLDLDLHGRAEVITDAAASADRAEALHRVRAWVDAGEVERALALAEGAAR